MAVETSNVETGSAAENVPAVLRQLKRYYGASDPKLALLTGIPRSTVQSRLSGATPCNASDLEQFAKVFEVPITVLYLPPKVALRWVLDHQEAVPEWLRPMASSVKGPKGRWMNSPARAA